MNITIPGNPVPAARVRLGKRVFTPSRYRNWKAAAALIIRTSADNPPPLPWAVSVSVFLATKRRCDGDNFLKAAMDALVISGILKDDCWQNVPDMGVRCFYSPTKPRVEIELHHVAKGD